MRNALRYACRRAQHTNGHVALLHVIEPAEFQHWLGVGRVLEEEARAEAELRMQALATEVFAQTGTMPVIHIREGKRAEQLVALLQEDPSISLLVLATASGGGNPGPAGHLPARPSRQAREGPGDTGTGRADPGGDRCC